MRKWILRRKVLGCSSSQKIAIGSNEYRSGHTLQLQGFSSNQRRRQLNSVVASQAMTLEAGQYRPDHYRMATMRTKKKAQPLTEREIDKIVVAQADDDAAWGKPVRVRASKTASVPLPSTLASRIAFFARLHREKSIEAWIERVIQERLDLEEAAFAGLKRDLATRASSAQQEL